jgi:hypothetical protein
MYSRELKKDLLQLSCSKLFHHLLEENQQHQQSISHQPPATNHHPLTISNLHRLPKPSCCLLDDFLKLYMIFKKFYEAAWLTYKDFFKAFKKSVIAHSTGNF